MEMKANVLVSMLVKADPPLSWVGLTSESLDSSSLDEPTLKVYMLGVNESWSKIVPKKLFVSDKSGILNEIVPKLGVDKFKPGNHDTYEEYLEEFFSESLWDFFSENGFDLDNELESAAVETFIDCLYDARGVIAVPKNKIFLGDRGQLNLTDAQRKKLIKKDEVNIISFFIRELDCSENMELIPLSSTDPVAAVQEFRKSDTWIADKYSMIGVILK
jgi:hypothetical protein